jgi:hypothetical protein
MQKVIAELRRENALLTSHLHVIYSVDVMCGNSNDYINDIVELTTAGGRIVCRRCNAMSKRTRLQCGGPAVRGKTKCRTHGGRSTGPRTDAGKLRCAQAKTIHGKDTRADRQVHRLAMKRLRLYAQILGVPFRSDAGDKRL